jgi:hypothetical protein
MPAWVRMAVMVWPISSCSSRATSCRTLFGFQQAFRQRRYAPARFAATGSARAGAECPPEQQPGQALRQQRKQ